MNTESQGVLTLSVAGNRLPDSTRIECAHLLVRDLPNSLHFYRDLVGLNVTWSRGDTTALSASSNGGDLVVLTEDRNAQPRSAHSAGLFHMALLYPTRRDLAAAFTRLSDQRWRFHGFADHGVSEALYMADPDGNGIELYIDRPREEWPRMDGELQMVTESLDLENLLAELNSPSQQQPGNGLTLGHIHLQVTSLQSADEFYHETLGFDVTQRSFPGALFVAAGGYHHHIGLNVWNSNGGSPSKDGTAGLIRFGIRVGSLEAVHALSSRLQKTSYLLTETERGIIVRDSDNIQVEILTQSNQYHSSKESV